MYLQKVKSKHNKSYFFFGILKVTDVKSRIRSRIHIRQGRDTDPYQYVTDTEHCPSRNRDEMTKI